MRHIPVSRETLDRLKLYVDLLQQWQRVKNLVAPKTLEEVWHRHIADSAQLYHLACYAAHKEQIEPAKLDTPLAALPALSDAPICAEAGQIHWVDIGSGAGFPGLVIAALMAEKEHGTMRLVESNGRKCAFLAEVARQWGLTTAAKVSKATNEQKKTEKSGVISVEIENSRIESLCESDKLTKADIISARALASLDKLLPLSAGLCQPKAIALFPKGKTAPEEYEAARQNWRFQAETRPSRTESEGRIMIVSEIAKL